MKRCLILLMAMAFCFCVTAGIGIKANGPEAISESNHAKVQPPLADWTVMVFMNGNNNLEPDAISNFRSMAEVGSTDQVKIVVQLARIGRYTINDPETEYWVGARRFLVKRRMEPTKANTVAGGNLGRIDMGSGTALKEFVTWARNAFPARHYMLILWDHGQGWRQLRALHRPIGESGASGTVGAPYRSISYDELSHHKLYNYDIQEALKPPAGTDKLDVIGFDACLMAMVETAYAMKNVAKVMVASEELEPGEGWRYDDWLRELVNNPSVDEAGVGKMLVASYQKTYRNIDQETTLSAVDVSRIESLATSISDLANEMRAKLLPELRNIKAARASCELYAPNERDALNRRIYFHHIDLAHFCDVMAQQTHDGVIRAKAQSVRASLNALVISNYRGAARQDAFGSYGLAIYFPESGALYRQDSYEEKGYQKVNTFKPVEFVQRQSWSDFLHDYFIRVPTL
jgi:hypothetical protein